MAYAREIIVWVDAEPLGSGGVSMNPLHEVPNKAGEVLEWPIARVCRFDPDACSASSRTITECKIKTLSKSKISLCGSRF